MKIYKYPSEIMYDTSNPTKCEYPTITRSERAILTPLHTHTHHLGIAQTDWEFLASHFEKDHPIFLNFGDAHFYVVN
jgi:hypothetical protein